MVDWLECQQSKLLHLATSFHRMKRGIEEEGKGCSGLCSDTLEQPVNTLCMASYNLAPGEGAALKFALFPHQNHVGPNYVARAALARSPQACFWISPGAECFLPRVSRPPPSSSPSGRASTGSRRSSASCRPSTTGECVLDEDGEV